MSNIQNNIYKLLSRGVNVPRILTETKKKKSSEYPYYLLLPVINEEIPIPINRGRIEKVYDYIDNHSIDQVYIPLEKSKRIISFTSFTTFWKKFYTEEDYYNPIKSFSYTRTQDIYYVSKGLIADKDLNLLYLHVTNYKDKKTISDTIFIDPSIFNRKDIVSKGIVKYIIPIISESGFKVCRYTDFSKIEIKNMKKWLRKKEPLQRDLNAFINSKIKFGMIKIQ